MRRILDNIVPPTSGQRFPALDGLRGVAILSITALHIWSVAHCPPTVFAPLLAAGSLGPSIFFAISGFMLYVSYVRDPDALRFYRRRAWRLIPPYYVAVLVWWVISPDHSPHQVLTHLTFTHGFALDTLGGLSLPLWFIAPLVHFYLLFPFIATAMRRWPVPVACIAFGISIAAQVLGGTLWQRSLPGHIGECVLGMYAAYLVASGHAPRIPAWFRRVAVAAAVTAPFVLFALRPVAQPPFWYWPSALYAPVWAGLLIISATSSISARTLSVAPLRAIGRVSYSLYLYNLVGSALAPGAIWPVQLLITASVTLAAYPLEQSARYLKQVHRLIRAVLAYPTVADGARR